MRPNIVGAKAMYFNPSNVVFSAAEIAAIDSTYDDAIISPYAYTATVREDYDAINYFFADDGSSIIPNGMRASFGLFIAPQNDKKNLLFQLSGKVVVNTFSNVGCRGFFFFGRKATDNTVVSSKAATSNQLAKYTMLPSQYSGIGQDNVGSTISQLHTDSIETELFSLELQGGFVYCFGYNMVADSADMTVRGGMSLSMRCFCSELYNFDPSR